MNFNEVSCIPVDPTSHLVYILSNLRTGDWFKDSIDTERVIQSTFLSLSLKQCRLGEYPALMDCSQISSAIAKKT